MNSGKPLAALARFGKWQIQSRIWEELVVDWIDGAQLAVRRGMTGATGNIYCGLHEYADMAFVLHLLRKDDLFLDLGANVGSYTVLASRVCGANSIAIEPDPDTVVRLRRNVAVNRVDDLVEIVETALGSKHGMARLSVGCDTTNKIVVDTSAISREVRMTSLDAIVGDRGPTLIKVDVEGYEAEVLNGARKTLRSESLLAVETETSDAEVTSALTNAGFERWYYEPTIRQLSRDRLKISASNALYIRDVPSVKRRLAEAPRRKVLGRVI